MENQDILQPLSEDCGASQSELPYAEEYAWLAKDAYQVCTEWFGPPDDPETPYSLCVSQEFINTCAYKTDRYVISLSPKLDTPQQRCGSIGHEMYHRITMSRPGLRTEPWVDEIAAFLASQWFLERHGHNDFAEKIRNYYVRRSTPIDLTALRRFRYPELTNTTPNIASHFPETFYPDVSRVATALSYVVERLDLVRLPWAESLPKWIVSLNADSRACVGRLLGLAERWRPSPQAPDWHSRMGVAWKVLGHFEEAVTSFRLALSQDGNDGDLLMNIGYCLERAGRTDDALDTYTQSVKLDARNALAAYSLGQIESRRENYTVAIGWYREALQRHPDWPCVLYWMGKTLSKIGQAREAREHWHRVIELGDAVYSDPARKALDACQDAISGIS